MNATRLLKLSAQMEVDWYKQKLKEANDRENKLRGQLRQPLLPPQMDKDPQPALWEQYVLSQHALRIKGMNDLNPNVVRVTNIRNRSRRQLLNTTGLQSMKRPQSTRLTGGAGEEN